MARRVLHLAERTWSETETTSQTAPGQRPKLQPAAAPLVVRGPAIGPGLRPRLVVPLVRMFSGFSVDSMPPWRLSIMARAVLPLKATSTALRS